MTKIFVIRYFLDGVRFQLKSTIRVTTNFHEPNLAVYFPKLFEPNNVAYSIVRHSFISNIINLSKLSFLKQIRYHAGLQGI